MYGDPGRSGYSVPVPAQPPPTRSGTRFDCFEAGVNSMPQPLCHCLQQVDPRSFHPRLPLALQPAARPDTATNALPPERHSGRPVPCWAQQDSRPSLFRVYIVRDAKNPTILFCDRLGPPCAFRALYVAPSISSMNRYSALSPTFDVTNSEVEPEGVRPSYPPLPLLMAPEPGTVVPVLNGLGTRTRSHTRRAAAICSHTIGTPRAHAYRVNCPTTTIPFILALMHDQQFLLRPCEMYDVPDAQFVCRHTLRPLLHAW